MGKQSLSRIPSFTVRARGRGRGRSRAAGAALGAALLVAASLALARPAAAQAVEAAREITVATGNSVVVTHDATLDRVSIGNPEVADAVVVSAREVVINGKQPGTTTLLLWDEGGNRRIYQVRVTADAPSLQRQLEQMFPGESLEATAMGNTVILSGEVRDPTVADKAVALARSLGEDVTVIDDLSVPDRGQILLKVRFAEVSKNALRELGPELYLADTENVAGGLGPGDVAQGQRDIDRDTDEGGQVASAFSDAVNFFLFHRPSGLGAFINALQTEGLFRSLAEPNLLAMPAESASFLAGGEFPFPVLQGGTGASGGTAVTIQFKEFGIRLNFVPTITNAGRIRLQVAPEVSSLDFANGLQISGFNIPALTSRKASTVIELGDGQTFAIAGLMDNSMTETVNKVPLLGDIPILGELFRSEDIRQNRTELLVLVTPQIVRPMDRSPPVPTGEPAEWRWKDHMRYPTGDPAPDSRR